MTSDLQADIRIVGDAVCHDDEAWQAWQRLKARLTPDRERVAEAVKRSAARRATRLTDFEALQIADAAIAAMGEP